MHVQRLFRDMCNNHLLFEQVKTACSGHVKSVQSDEFHSHKQKETARNPMSTFAPVVPAECSVSNHCAAIPARFLALRIGLINQAVASYTLEPHCIHKGWPTHHRVCPGNIQCATY